MKMRMTTTKALNYSKNKSKRIIPRKKKKI
uniref:Uncharacterized protein n=1 Tax=Arundo donax TaxID=35708 RepID=A0A0A8ZWS0_ARUDO